MLACREEQCTGLVEFGAVAVAAANKWPHVVDTAVEIVVSIVENAFRRIVFKPGFEHLFQFRCSITDIVGD